MQLVIKRKALAPQFGRIQEVSMQIDLGPDAIRNAWYNAIANHPNPKHCFALIAEDDYEERIFTVGDHQFLGTAMSSYKDSFIARNRWNNDAITLLADLVISVGFDSHVDLNPSTTDEKNCLMITPKRNGYDLRWVAVMTDYDVKDIAYRYAEESPNFSRWLISRAHYCHLELDRLLPRLLDISPQEVEEIKTLFSQEYETPNNLLDIQKDSPTLTQLEVMAHALRRTDSFVEAVTVMPPGHYQMQDSILRNKPIFMFFHEASAWPESVKRHCAFTIQNLKTDHYFSTDRWVYLSKGQHISDLPTVEMFRYFSRENIYLTTEQTPHSSSILVVDCNDSQLIRLMHVSTFKKGVQHAFSKLSDVNKPQFLEDLIASKLKPIELDLVPSSLDQTFQTGDPANLSFLVFYVQRFFGLAVEDYEPWMSLVVNPRDATLYYGKENGLTDDLINYNQF